MEQKVHIYEEETNLFWGLIILVCTVCGTYVLTGSFTASKWSNLEFSQLLALFLFIISFIGIFKLAEPLYHFHFHIEGKSLVIEAMKGEQHVKTISIALNEIESLKFSPDQPRSRGEALFDFAKNYHLMWRKRGRQKYTKMLEIENASFVLKVDDIADIIRFIRRHQKNVHIPREQAEFFGL